MDDERKRALADALFGPEGDPTAWKREALALVNEILCTSEAIRKAKEFGGHAIVRTDARWKLLREIERVGLSRVDLRPRVLPEGQTTNGT